MAMIYHITTRDNWERAKREGFYEIPSLKEEGFIHCCEEQQVDGVLQRYYAGKTDLLKLMIDTSKLTNRFVFEWSPSTQDTFPHIYGPINLDAVCSVEEIRA
jgi:uncharacterized protein (DUF952 family)